MITEPWFQSGIINQIIVNLSYSLFFRNWIYYVGMAFIVLIFVSLILQKYIQPIVCPDVNSDYKYKKSTVLLLFASLFAYVFVVFSLEQSFLNNLDLRGHVIMQTFLSGRKVFWGQIGRIAPLENFDTNIIFAITHNMILINIYVIVTTIVNLCLIFKLFDFINLNRRLFLLSFIILMPGFFWLNNIIYPERWGLFFVLSSLLLLKRNKLLWFTVFMNLALYTKESYVLIYMGLLIYLMFSHLLTGDLVMKSFIRPIESIKQFPLEFIIFLSCFIYIIVFCSFTSGINSGSYLKARQQNLIILMLYYKVEICINLLALYFFVKNIKKKKYLLREGLFFSATFFNFYILFVLKLSYDTYHLENKPYYMSISTIFNIMYVINYIKYEMFLMLFLLYFMVHNCFAYRIEEGKIYRQLFNFFQNEAKNNEQIVINLFGKIEEKVWRKSTYNTSFKYYMPGENIVFKYDIGNSLGLGNDLYFPVISSNDIDVDDYVVIKKNEHYNDMINKLEYFEYDKKYENKLFEVYYIKIEK